MRPFALAAALLLPACGSSPSASSAALDLTGTWTGSGRGFSVTWQLVQDGSTVSGTSRFSDGDGFTGQGRVTASVSGSEITFQDEYPAVTNPAGTLSCTERASGRGPVSGGTMTLTYSSTSSCRAGDTGASLTLRR